MRSELKSTFTRFFELTSDDSDFRQLNNHIRENLFPDDLLSVSSRSTRDRHPDLTPRGPTGGGRTVQCLHLAQQVKVILHWVRVGQQPTFLPFGCTGAET